MKLVRIIKNWQCPDILRQTPKSAGEWDKIKFTIDPVDECDYVIVSNFAVQKTEVKCPKENVWCILQEPPNEYFRYIHKANKIYTRVFTQDPGLKGERYVKSQPALPWHVEKTYDFLKKIPMPKKSKNLSFITSSKKKFQGQKDRMRFLENLRPKIKFDLFGRGFKPIDDKWGGLASYRYSLAIENFSGPYYWSEKLADCFLSWTMPLYYGCTNITDYFPKESFVSIDINDSNVFGKIEEVISSNLQKKNLEAIDYARKLVLEKYQFFPFMVEHIKEWEKRNKPHRLKKETVVIPNENTLRKKFVMAFNRRISEFFNKK